MALKIFQGIVEDIQINSELSRRGIYIINLIASGKMVVFVIKKWTFMGLIKFKCPFELGESVIFSGEWKVYTSKYRVKSDAFSSKAAYIVPKKHIVRRGYAGGLGSLFGLLVLLFLMISDALRQRGHMPTEIMLGAGFAISISLFFVTKFLFSKIRDFIELQGEVNNLKNYILNSGV